MYDSKTLVLSDVNYSMAALVADKGWTLVRCYGLIGYNTSAVIKKDGIVLSYANSKGEQDYGVSLATEVHPVLSRELYSAPSLLEIFSEIGVQTKVGNVVFEADKNLCRIKDYLSDTKVWERRVNAAAANLLSRYTEWSTGPELTRELAKSLANRHPWLAEGNVPDPNELASVMSSSAPKTKRVSSGLIFGIVGISIVIYRYLT